MGSFNPSDTARVVLVDENGNPYKATGGGGSAEIQVNGVDTADQTLIDFVDSATVTFANPFGGQIQATAAGGGIADPGANGILSRTALDTTVARTISGTSNQISVSNGDGVSANPIISIPSSAQLDIAKITNLTTNGFVKTSSSDGSLGIDTSTYLTAATQKYLGPNTIVLSPLGGGSDDSAQINTALATVYNAGGGTVFLTNGHYLIKGAFDATTNSILTLPQTSTDQLMRRVRLIGESMGSTSGTNATTYVGGVLLDATGASAGSGTLPALYAAAPYTTGGSLAWNNVCCLVDNIAFMLPSAPSFNGLSFINAIQAEIGDNVFVFAALSGGAVSDPGASTSFGVLLPQKGNNFISQIGSCEILGFSTGIYFSEHARLQRPVVSSCFRALYSDGSPLIAHGYVNTFNCARQIETNNGVTAEVVLDIQMSMENQLTSGWNKRDATADIIQASGTLDGRLEYVYLASSGFVSVVTSGAPPITLVRLH